MYTLGRHAPSQPERSLATGTVFTTNRTLAVRLPAEMPLPEGIKRVAVPARGAERVMAPGPISWDSFILDGPPATEDLLAERAEWIQAPHPSCASGTVVRRQLLATNIATSVMHQRQPEARVLFNRHAGRMAISAGTLAELLHGAEKSSRPDVNPTVVEDFCSQLEVLAYVTKAATRHGALRGALERAGPPIGVNDLPLAAHARSEGLALMTDNRAGSSACRRFWWKAG